MESLKAIQDGRFGLDQDVNTILKTWKVPGHPFGGGAPATPRTLMSHTSGLGYGWSSPIVSRLTANSRDKETEIPLLFDPGDKWAYGASTRVLGQVVEKIAGQPLDVFFRDRIVGPLKMTDTAFYTPDLVQDSLLVYTVAANTQLYEFPDGSTEPLILWEDDDVYINGTYPIDPPTIGVATFDGLARDGHPYNPRSELG